jgi:Na+-transporting methylmalonyl-CoA/oxaloacetate decarboxylase gamma subunit
VIFAETSWADASIAIAGVAFVTIVISIVVWQIFATGRTGISAKRENAYQKLAEESAEAQRKTAEQLEKATSELTQLRRQTTELERVLKEVE